MAHDSKTAFVRDAWEWAEQQFGGCELGDRRRTRRVVDYAARQAVEPGGSTNAVCSGDDAAAEGAYRMVRNPHIEPMSIEAGPFSWTAQQCVGRKVVLAIQDTTTLTISTTLGEELGELGKDGSGGRGILVHSTLAVDADTQEPIGLLDQLRWQRNEQRPSKHARKQRQYEDKESYKWEQASRRVCERVATMDTIITVCDREADIYEFIQYHVENAQRFVVRASQDRGLEAQEGRLWEYMRGRPVNGRYEITISQRGAQRKKGRGSRPAREKRTVQMATRTATVTLLPPASRRAATKPIQVHALLAQEVGCPEGETPLEWMLLTSEPVSRKCATMCVVRYYELRWLIEEFHKSWKTGCRIEQRPVQSVDNLERLAVITAPIAVRLLQLRAVAESNPTRPCEPLLTPAEWQCLWAMTEGGTHPPRKPPSTQWALHAVAKLAGWRDTKRTGRVGWQMLWKGWMKLEQCVAVWNLAREALAI